MARVLDVGGVYKTPRPGSAVGAVARALSHHPDAGSSRGHIRAGGDWGGGRRMRLRTRESMGASARDNYFCLKPTKTQYGGEGTIDKFF